jgi:hypothetical protein
VADVPLLFLLLIPMVLAITIRILHLVLIVVLFPIRLAIGSITK